MNQRRFAFCLSMFVGVLSIWLAISDTAAAAQDKPNILLIVSDDQGWPDLGCIGKKPIQTPHLDQLAKDGVRLTNYYVTWPACTPSRGSILTGRHPLRNGLYDMVRNDMVNYGHKYSPEEYTTSPEMTLGLDPREQTLGDLLRRGGYRTGMVGKWDMGQARRYLPLQRGFDFFYGHGNNGIDYYTHERYGVHSLFAGNTRSTADQGTYATDLFKREALRFINSDAAIANPPGSAPVGPDGPAGPEAAKRSASKGSGASSPKSSRPSTQPWFLYLCFNAPHGASSFGPPKDGKKTGVGVQAPAEYVARYAGTSVPENLKRYYAAVTCMDDAIGEILALIRQRGEEHNTLVIFQSDNGGSGNGGNAPLRGQKSTLWEGGLRIPCVIRWPAKIPAGRETAAFLTTLEILPTLAAAAGQEPPVAIPLDGHNMLPVLTEDAPSPRTEMFWEFRNQKAARVGNYKWIDSKSARGLYDLTTDLSEQTDLTESQPTIATDITTRWNTWRKSMDQSDPRGPFRDY